MINGVYLCYVIPHYPSLGDTFGVIRSTLMDRTILSKRQRPQFNTYGVELTMK
jgi:hypothetical protein